MESSNKYQQVIIKAVKMKVMNSRVDLLAGSFHQIAMADHQYLRFILSQGCDAGEPYGA